MLLIASGGTLLQHKSGKSDMYRILGSEVLLEDGCSAWLVLGLLLLGVARAARTTLSNLHSHTIRMGKM